MKNVILILAFSLFSNSIIGQVPKGDYLQVLILSGRETVLKTSLNKARLISEITSVNPGQWNETAEHVSTEIIANINGKNISSKGKSDELSADQKKLLSKVDVGAEFSVKIRFKYKGESGKTEDVEWKFEVTAENQAEYPGGSDQILDYFYEMVFNKITKEETANFKTMIVKFSVNAEGRTSGASVIESSSDLEVDKLVKDAINKMPLWKAAEIAGGLKVKQEVRLSIFSNAGGGC